MGKEEAITRPLRKNTRWTISSLLCGIIILNYFDRVAISIAAPELQQSFALTTFEIGLIFTIYNYSYTLMQLPIGSMLDKWGVSWVTRAGMLAWSILTLLLAFVHGKFLLYLLRFLTGITSSSAFPAASKATANWFPLHERALANALFDSSAKLSNVIGAPLTAVLITAFDWRTAFLAIGILNVIITLIFWGYYDEPGRHKRISEEEINYIQRYGDPTIDAPEYKTSFLLKKLFSSRKLWGLMIGFTGYGYTFNLLLLWLPTFFKQQFKLDLLSTSLLIAIPWFVSAIAGITAGGFLVDYLIKRGMERSKVYRRIITIGMLLGLAFLGSLLTENPALSMIFITIGLAGISSTAPIGWTIANQISPPGTTAFTSSIVNFANNLFGGIIASALTGYIVEVTGSFQLAFLIAGGVLLTGLFFYLFVLGEINPISIEE